MSITIAARASHPPGLYVLFFTEMWERYSFYSMMAILSLYMNEALHFDVAHVGRVYGAYTAGVYLVPVAGGLIAGRWLGFTRAVIVRGVAMLLSLITFTTFKRHLAEADVKVDDASPEVKTLPPGEVRSRVITLFGIFGISLVFWIAFYQIFYTFTFWARDSTSTTWAPETF